MPIQYKDFRQFIINLLVKKGESVTLSLQNNVEQGQKKTIKKLQKLVDTNEQKKKALLDLYLEGLIDKREFEKKRNDLEIEVKRANQELFILKVMMWCIQMLKVYKKLLNSYKRKVKTYFMCFKL